jgi:hypothetical protein
MRAAALGKVEETASARILADVDGLGGDDTSKRAPALIRLEAELGREFAHRLVTALTHERGPTRKTGIG